MARHDEERGTVLVIVAFAMASLIGMAVLTLDLGRYLEFRRQLQNAADSAAHAAALQLPNEVAAETEATNYFDLNRPTFGDATFDIIFRSGNDARVRVEAEGDLDMIFAPFFGWDTGHAAVVAEVGATAKDLMVVIDRSGSMCQDSHSGTCPNPPNTWEPFTSVQNAAIGFSGLFSPTYDRLGLVSYSNSATEDLALSGDFGPGSAFDDEVMTLGPNGRTNIGHPIAVARAELMGPNGRPDSIKVIVLLTDGVANVYRNSSGGFSNCQNSNGCTQAYNYAVAQAQLAADDDIVIYTIGLGSEVDDALLQEIADVSGGSYVWAPTADDLDATFEQIASMVRIRFVE